MLAARPEAGFTLPRCAECGKFHFYPKDLCPHCGSKALAWTEASGRGEVYSFSVVHRAPSPAFKDQVPYVLAIIATEEGPHLLSRVVGVAPDRVAVGLRVKAKAGSRPTVFEVE